MCDLFRFWDGFCRATIKNFVVSGLMDLDEVLKFVLASRSAVSCIRNGGVSLVLAHDFGRCAFALRLQRQVRFPSVLRPLKRLDVRPSFAIYNKGFQLAVETRVVQFIVSTLEYSCFDQVIRWTSEVFWSKDIRGLSFLPRQVDEGNLCSTQDLAEVVLERFVPKGPID